MNKKILGLVLTALLIPGLAHAYGKFVVNGTNGGQWTDLYITGASTATTKRSGEIATIDLSSIAQTSASATTTPVLALNQAATTGPLFGVTCTSGAALGAGNTSTCSSYATTISAKTGTIKVYINGVAKYVDFKDSPM